MLTTASDISAFLSCRRRWALTSHSAARLAARKRAPALELGREVHLGLERTLRNPLAVDLSDLSPEAVSLVAHHNLRWGLQNPLAPHRVFVDAEGPVVERTWLLSLPGGHRVAGTFDAVAEDEDGDLWVTDHKSYAPGKRPRMELVELSWQFRLYVAAARRLWPDRTVRGAVYNGLAKRQPASFEPVNGRLPTDQKSLKKTSYCMYVASLLSHYLAYGDPHHQRALAALLTTEARERWHYRRELPIPHASDPLLWAQLNVVLDEMQRAEREPEYALPALSTQTCAGCPGVAYCQAVERGSEPPLALYEPASGGQTLSKLEEEGLL